MNEQEKAQEAFKVNELIKQRELRQSITDLESGF